VPTCLCWWQLAHSDWGEDGRFSSTVLRTDENSVKCSCTCTIYIPSNTVWLVGWSLTCLFSTNTAISQIQLYHRRKNIVWYTRLKSWLLFKKMLKSTPSNKFLEHFLSAPFLFLLNFITFLLNRASSMLTCTKYLTNSLIYISGQKYYGTLCFTLNLKNKLHSHRFNIICWETVRVHLSWHTGIVWTQHHWIAVEDHMRFSTSKTRSSW